MITLRIKVNDRPSQTLSLKELQDRIKCGGFGKDDRVWSEEAEDWIAAGEITELKDFFHSNNGTAARRAAKIYAVAGGKGGVGKSVLAASLGVGLAAMGKDVILIDADLGGANLHTCMGMLEPRYTLFDFYSLEKETLADIVLPTPVENLRLISGACGTLGLANPTPGQKQNFVQDLKKLRADTIILDLGAGSNVDIIDFFLPADEKILVVTPEPTSLYEAFGFIKVCLLHALHLALQDHPAVLALLAKQEVNRPGKAQPTMSELEREVEKIDAAAATVFRNTRHAFTPKLILNMVRNRDQIKEGMALQIALMELLAVDADYLGYISYDPKVSESVMHTKPLLLYAPDTPAAQDLSALIRVKLLGKKGVKEFFEKKKWQKQMRRSSRDYPSVAGLPAAPICSIDCFYWDHCEYQQGGRPCRVRHLEPVLSDQTRLHQVNNLQANHFTFAA